MNQFLPIFTKRENPLFDDKLDHNCGAAFVKHYIKANNNLLLFTQNKGSIHLKNIISETEKMLKACDEMESYANSILGSAFYHSDNIEKAKFHLEKSIELDSLNCLAMVYLNSIYYKNGEKENNISTIKTLKKYSPSYFRNYISE